MEEQLNKKAKAVRIKKHTSGGVLVEVDSNLGAVVGEKKRISYVHPRK